MSDNSLPTSLSNISPQKDLHTLEQESLEKTSLFLSNLVSQSKATVFSSPKELDAAIRAYFTYCEKHLRHPTLNGLAFALGTTRKDLITFPTDSVHYPLIKSAIQRIAALVEESLLVSKNASGAFAWLKNNDEWSDKSEIKTIKQLTAADIIKRMQEGKTLEVDPIDGTVVNE